jgi:hypothetical protein
MGCDMKTAIAISLTITRENGEKTILPFSKEAILPLLGIIMAAQDKPLSELDVFDQEQFQLPDDLTQFLMGPSDDESLKIAVLQIAVLFFLRRFDVRRFLDGAKASSREARRRFLWLIDLVQTNDSYETSDQKRSALRELERLHDGFQQVANPLEHLLRGTEARYPKGTALARLLFRRPQDPVRFLACFSNCSGEARAGLLAILDVLKMSGHALTSEERQVLRKFEDLIYGRNQTPDEVDRRWYNDGVGFEKE